MQTAARIIDLAKQNARVAGYDAQALVFLNAILSGLCQHHDFALARGAFNFNFNPTLATNFGSGPYRMPLDYLRTSGSSGAKGQTRSSWYLYPTPSSPQGQRLYMTPIDLAEFDLYPQYPSQSTPDRWATDMGGPLTDRIVLATTASLTEGSTTGVAAASTNLRDDLSMAGEGVQAGTVISGVSGANFTMSLPATLTQSAASVFFGVAPVGYAYPPPLGSYPVTIRYQRQMPDITDIGKIPWFPDEGYLIEELSAYLMETSDDSRADNFYARAGRRLQKYLDLSDDKTNRAQQIQLDLRNFRQRGTYDRLRNTKIQGW